MYESYMQNLIKARENWRKNEKILENKYFKIWHKIQECKWATRKQTRQKHHRTACTTKSCPVCLLVRAVLTFLDTFVYCLFRLTHYAMSFTTNLRAPKILTVRHARYTMS